MGKVLKSGIYSFFIIIIICSFICLFVVFVTVQDTLSDKKSSEGENACYKNNFFSFLTYHVLFVCLCKPTPSMLQSSPSGSSRRLQAKLLKRNAGGQLSPSVVRRGSSSLSVPRRNSAESLALSHKDDKMSTITVGKEEKSLEKGEENDFTSKDTNIEKKSERKISEIQVIPLLSPETPQVNQARKLLPQRSRSSKRLLSNKQLPKSAGKKRVPLDAISCISDYSVLSNIEFAPRKSSAGKRGQQEGTSLLTSKLLKDFTNSPEGECLLFTPGTDTTSIENVFERKKLTKCRNLVAIGSEQFLSCHIFFLSTLLA